MMEIIGLHHISLTVENLKECKHFYGNVLGLDELERPNFDFPGAWYQVGEQQLHLIQYSKSQTLRTHNTIDTKEAHIAIRVRDYEATLNHLRAHLVPFQENLSTKSGFIQVFCTDPDGNVIELNVDH
ncbi:VOC family protein [Bacillus niameyensis]|uniref:VOC family protein n=1 Tax=Bacillus niameyensis TaxID=1522308 RepID=UPI0007808BE3|nr:VOC family protein [Bacillus niameyensis]